MLRARFEVQKSPLVSVWKGVSSALVVSYCLMIPSTKDCRMAKSVYVRESASWILPDFIV